MFAALKPRLEKLGEEHTELFLNHDNDRQGLEEFLLCEKITLFAEAEAQIPEALQRSKGKQEDMGPASSRRDGTLSVQMNCQKVRKVEKSGSWIKR